jgi:hypothetical protein
MQSVLRVGLALVILSLVPGGWAWAQESLTRRDSQGPVTVEVTLLPPATSGVPLRARVVLDTHSVALDGIALEQAVVLRVNGTEVSATRVEQATGGGHHRQAIIVFPAVARPGGVEIAVRNVGGVAERVLAWDLPASR